MSNITMTPRMWAKLLHNSGLDRATCEDPGQFAIAWLSTAMVIAQDNGRKLLIVAGDPTEAPYELNDQWADVLDALDGLAGTAKGLECQNCRRDTSFSNPEGGEQYMVHDELWEEYGVGDGRLCVDCIEARLGRRLVPSDFTDVPLNQLDCQSRRLQERLQE